MRWLLGAVVVFMLSGSALAQSAHPIVGSWNLEFERGRQMENGVATPVMGRGTLVVQMSGPSFTATLDAGPRPDGSAARPVVMQGSVRDGSVVFEQRAKGRLDINGKVTDVDVTTTWSLQVNGDDLTGTMTRVVPLAPDAGGSAPVRGRRVR